MALSYKNISGSTTANGCSNTGKITATFETLVKLFGEPERLKQSDGDDDKVQVEWVIEWEDGTISTIYDWKWYGVEPESIVEWNIGGLNYKSAAYVQELISGSHD